MDEALDPRVATARTGAWPRRLVPVVLAGITALAYLPILANGFVDWDDTRNLLENPHYRGLGWTQLRWMATQSHNGHFVPLAWFTLALDYVLWGMNPFGYHLTSLVIHAATTGILYVVARELIARAVSVRPAPATTGAAAAALLFGLHPLRVESVAWATERRDVLSGLFFLLTMLAYVRSTAATGARRRWLIGGSAVAHLAALLSKSTALMAPLVLVLLDVYPLRRLSPTRDGWVSARTARILAEKLPHVALSVAQALLTYRFFGADLKVGRLLSWPESLSRVLSSLWFYPVKTLAPLALSPLYEARPGLSPTDPLVLQAATGVILVTALAWLVRHRCPGLTTAWAAYVIMLAPVSGAVSLGYHLTADRYSYLPCLGFAVLAGGGIAIAIDASARRPGWAWLAPLVLGVTLIVVVGLGALTVRQARVWHDTASLWRHAVAVAPECLVCQVNLGYELLSAHDPEAALKGFQRALALQPTRAATRWSIGLALEAMGRRGEAISAYREGLTLAPQDLSLRLALATALLADGRVDDTVGVVEGAWRYYPPGALVHYFEDAVQHKPDAPVPRLGLVRARWRAGERERARSELQELRRLAPELADRAGAGIGPS
jgi:protein O-mannosyl-transferase